MGAQITRAVETAVDSNVAAEVEALIPATAVWAAEVKVVLAAFDVSLKALGDPASALYHRDGFKGLLQRLGSQITAIAHGGKHPFGFYVKAFESVFNGTAPSTGK